MTEKDKRQRSQKKTYQKPELKKHSKIKSRPAEVFVSIACCAPVPEVV